MLVQGSKKIDAAMIIWNAINSSSNILNLKCNKRTIGAYRMMLTQMVKIKMLLNVMLYYAGWVYIQSLCTKHRPIFDNMT